jgi:SMC interacting uncharacterized protein involved in chromosome segregation
LKPYSERLQQTLDGCERTITIKRLRLRRWERRMETGTRMGAAYLQRCKAEVVRYQGNIQQLRRNIETIRAKIDALHSGATGTNTKLSQ